jgi:hypothetical protein
MEDSDRLDGVVAMVNDSLSDGEGQGEAGLVLTLLLK